MGMRSIGLSRLERRMNSNSSTLYSYGLSDKEDDSKKLSVRFWINHYFGIEIIESLNNLWEGLYVAQTY